jgi:spermidine synthase
VTDPNTQESRGSVATVTTCAIFLFSGAAALTFETLWFRQTGLVLGNTVWASALVTASFMAGLAMGNAFAIRRGWRLARPLRVFAALEIVVAVTGSSLVLAMPALGATLAPVLSRLQGSVALDGARWGTAFVLLLVPASAMGATLPVLARSLGARDANFGRVLGRLYGWNTLGAVAGALASEALLIPALGVRGTGLAAGTLDLLAASGAWLLDRRQAPLPAVPPSQKPPPIRGSRIAASAFLAGLLLLALEVVWFRFLLMFVWATAETFAIMLAVVLAGIAAGGLLGAAWLGRRPADSRHAPIVALASGAAVAATYGLFDRALPPPGAASLEDWTAIARALLLLTLPACLGSGILFTFLGKSLHAEAGDESRTAGLLTLSNTIGAMLGSLLAGFVLLPRVGMERSLFALALAYAIVAALASKGPAPSQRWPRRVAWGSFAVVLGLFPFGAMDRRYVRRVEEHWRQSEGAHLAAVEEGLTETVFLLRRDALGEPLAWRLLTNGMGMSTTDYWGRRYMGMFVWLPVALHPAPRTALLISYGLGNTARTLTATPELTHIDVVDVSMSVMRMSTIVWPDPGDNPLLDQRVEVHVEDGRFFLSSSRRRYDLITGEPPPPKSAGIVNLYSREYFHLMRERLADGGIATYWLPVLHLEPREAYSIARGFCDVFDDCSLWTGFGHDWILAGTRGGGGPVSEERFTRQWNDPLVGPRLRAAGLASPAQLGSSFLADAAQLSTLTDGVAPLLDNYPYRIDPRKAGPFPSPEYARLMDANEARERFRGSAMIRRLWPAGWTEKTLSAFERQAVLNRLAWVREGILPSSDTRLQAAAMESGDETLTMWSLGTSAEEQAVAARVAAAGSTDPELFEVQGLRALARREYRDAESLLARAEPHALHVARLRRWRILALDLAGDRGGAARLLAESEPLVRGAALDGDKDGWRWISNRLEASRPARP